MMDETDEKQRAFVEACIASRPRGKTEVFDLLVKELDNELMAEMMWIYWGAAAVNLDSAPSYFNQHLRWWKFDQEKRTFRKLLQTPKGKAEVWQMLNDASAWLL